MPSRRLAGFFAIDFVPTTSGWHRESELLTSDIIDRRLAYRQEAMSLSARRDLSARHCASIASVSLFSRLVSPTVGAAVFDAPGPMEYLWADEVRAELPLASSTLGPVSVADLIDRLIDPLVHLIHDEAGTSLKGLRGNVAAALAGATGTITMQLPEMQAAADAVLDEALTHPLLDGCALSTSPFRRRSCCQLWRWRSDSLCHDCLLSAPPVSEPVVYEWDQIA